MSALFDDKYSFGGAVEAAYVVCGRTLDDLPYTPEFDALCEKVRETFPSKTHREILHHLHNARKAKKLPATGIEGGPAPKLSDEANQILIGAVVATVGSIGSRDQLPYTDGFDRVANVFAQKSRETLTRHDLWRAISHLSKTPSDR